MDNRIAILQQIFNKLNLQNDISDFGKIIEYYISTGYNKILTPKQVDEELQNHTNHLPTRANFDNYFDNIITNGYFTHSFNGYMLEHYKKNGIGAKLNDEELTENFKILEKYIGVSNYVAKYAKTISEFYITSPGNNSIYYALMQSPERLWHGPLSQKDDESPILPVVGETKSQYAMRIVKDKIIKRSLNLEEADEVIKAAKIVIGKLCTTNPVVAFIPARLLMNSYVMKSGIFYKSLGNIDEMDYVKKEGKELSKYLQNQIYYDAQTKQVDTTFFCKNFGGDWDRSELDDVSVLGTIIPFDKVQTIDFDDSFAVCQRILKHWEVEDGTPFDFNRVLLTYYYYGQPKEKRVFDAYEEGKTSLHRK